MSFILTALHRRVELGGCQDMSLPISSDYQIVPSNNFNQTIKYVFLDASEICHTIDIISQEVKVNAFENCVLSRTHIHGRSKNRLYSRIY